MTKFVVRGGKPLKGTIETSTTKNSTVAILCASLMIRGKVTLKDIPNIVEVDRFLEILDSIGVIVERVDDSTLVINSSAKLQMDNIHKEACEKTRASLLFIGALASREKSYKIYKSGGCKLGARTIGPHLFALEQFGISIVSKSKYYDVKNKSLHSADIVMYESGDTPTENAIMAAVLAPGETIIKFASSNYMVQDLCYFLKKAGALIEGIGTTTLKITGVKKLKSVDTYYIMPDPIVAMTWISLAVTTKSNLTVSNCPLDFLELELEKLRVMGQKYKITNVHKSRNGYFNIADILLKSSSLVALSDKIYGRPFPGLNIDNLPLFGAMLTQARGKTLIHDWVYENRALYMLELQKLGANVLLLDTHRVMIEGPTTLKANEVICPPAIRPGIVILIAMIAAKGRSVLRHVYPLERGYADLIFKLRGIGVDIERLED
ncbi:MAG: UDP-N-acetylglucosamine 1-carboxyvinyltransferase [Candidatus Magasanikbacteria bacterium CG_4_10_14_0_2_um_filter_37_12]|uniref:UDP-N-acetylglucosamine 1-carboxyvinyltransferase n=1 Tax=Candidatus Magasanikbacteria bacterium CG_4_10_14_0_2_um_filter_37_12 TaxID=1974637 RepID=A0A2M7V8R7_9BACT|nr:MAG: UDP-N-acetylglucosamine 1-carboxyvinyltransferase [Candidatus Magasanikbacteria bacterium CG_4_10_14_0_2_um_filter_37_12]